MKKYLFLAALLCGTSFATMGAAVNSTSTTNNNEIAYANNSNDGQESLAEILEFRCITFSLSCGGEATSCGSTLPQILEFAVVLDDALCD